MDVEIVVVLRRKPSVLPKEAPKGFEKLKLSKIYKEGWYVVFQARERNDADFHKACFFPPNKHLYTTSCLVDFISTNWLRKRQGWTEIIRPGATRLGIAFIALKSLCDHKHDLQAIVTSPDYKKVIRLVKAKEVNLMILNESFWNNCASIVNVMTQMLRLLRICDSDEKPTLGYVYEGMYKAKKGIKKLFRNNRELYTPYINIIRNRRDMMLCKSLHAAACWLNSVFQYDQFFCSKKPEVVGGKNIIILFCYFPSDEWWKLHGEDALELQKFAIRILSQITSSSGCESNWSVFERIHAKRRNRLEHQMLNDLVYVHYNLRLQNRLKDYKKSYDPIDYESIDKIKF
uniref:HAT C-terminal dimerisation domain-containing protein n=1 Tax=Lactuca sativa TaxID=4236 RepID=A0A9R1VU46_LACSA|nr:hypothetical protein LSAT_V11C400190050 [Lactuca sativa]